MLLRNASVAFFKIRKFNSHFPLIFVTKKKVIFKRFKIVILNLHLCSNIFNFLNILKNQNYMVEVTGL